MGPDTSRDRDYLVYNIHDDVINVCDVPGTFLCYIIYHDTTQIKNTKKLCDVPQHFSIP
jgi:hypothetical protein